MAGPVPVLEPLPVPNIGPITDIGGTNSRKPGSKNWKKKKALGITTNMEPYDILKDLGSIQPTITI